MNKTLILFAALGILALAGIFVIFAIPAPRMETATPPEEPMNTAPSSSGLAGSATGGLSGGAGGARESIGGGISAMAPAVSEEKRKQLDEIQAAMVTYSAESLPVLKPYLSSPDPQVRAAAIDAVVQLAAPEGADLLRGAAKSAKSPEEQEKLLQAASYLELPRFPVEEFLNTETRGAAPQR